MHQLVPSALVEHLVTQLIQFEINVLQLLIQMQVRFHALRAHLVWQVLQVHRLDMQFEEMESNFLSRHKTTAIQYLMMAAVQHELLNLDINEPEDLVI